MDEIDQIRQYKDRLRIFLILFFFSDEYEDVNNPHFKKIFKSEVKIQKIDFLLRNPDYLAYELLLFAKQGKFCASEIKWIVADIFKNKEPILRKLEMERFFFGAYEDIDDVISFLKSINFISFTSKKNAGLLTVEKIYYITDYALSKVQVDLAEVTSLQWHIDRCKLIKYYFGDLSGTQLKAMQYQIDEYRNTSYKDYIGDIQVSVREKYTSLYGEVLP
jgi:hypothetical protein